MSTNDQVAGSLMESIEQDALPHTKDGVQEHVETALVAHQVPRIITQELADLGQKVPQTDEFGFRAIQLVTSRTFLKSFSDELGVPNAGENRDQFIERGKAILRGLLRKILRA